MRMVTQACFQIYLSGSLEGITACSSSSLPSRWRIAPHKPWQQRGSQEWASCNIKQGVCIHPVWDQGQFPLPNMQQETAIGFNFLNLYRCWQSQHLPTICLEGAELRQECKLGEPRVREDSQDGGSGKGWGWMHWQGIDALKSWDFSIHHWHTTALWQSEGAFGLCAFNKRGLIYPTLV